MSAPVLVIRHELVLSPETERALEKLGQAVAKMLRAGWTVSPPASAPETADPAREPQAPAPDAATAGPRRGAVWTEARDALMREGWPQGEAAEALLARLNALPGAPVLSATAVRKQAFKLGLARLPGKVITDAPRNSAKWNDARDAVIARDVPDMVAWAEIVARVDALPGAPVGSEMAVQQRAKRLGIRRDPARLQEQNRARMTAYQAGLRAQRAALAAEPGSDVPAAPAIDVPGVPEPEAEALPSEPEAAPEPEAEPEPAPEPEPVAALEPEPEPEPEPATMPAAEPEPPAIPGEIVPDRPEFVCLGKPLTRPQVVDIFERMGMRFTGDLTAINRKRAHTGHPPIEKLEAGRPVKWW